MQSGETKRLLDHGYIKFIEHYGSDKRIIEAARMSTDKGFRTWFPYRECTKCGSWAEEDYFDLPETRWLEFNNCVHNWRKVPKGDEGLLRYLYREKHSTPFEFAGVVIEVQAPIFVFREWHRHRTQSYNEMSARYIPLPNVNYVPTVERLMLMGGGHTKQAGTVEGALVLTEEAAIEERADLLLDYEYAEQRYQRALKRGVPKELARIRLPVGRYSRMRANANLRNWLAFMTLRSAPNAQWEIRQYSDALGEFIARLYPRTWNLFVEGRKG